MVWERFSILIHWQLWNHVLSFIHIFVLQFKPNDSISFKDPHFNPDPKPEDKMHVLAMVVR